MKETSISTRCTKLTKLSWVPGTSPISKPPHNKTRYKQNHPKLTAWGGFCYTAKRTGLTCPAVAGIKKSTGNDPVLEPTVECSMEGLWQLSEDIGAKVNQLEIIQQKLNSAKALKDQKWEQIYGAQFDAMFFQLTYMVNELKTKQHELHHTSISLKRHNRNSRKYSPMVKYSGYSVSAPNFHSEVLVQDEIRKITSFIPELYHGIHIICKELIELLNIP